MPVRESKILGPDGKPLSVSEPDLRPRASYDAAKTDDANRRHWAAADGLSALNANSAGVRTKLRNRSRYERANGGYYKGLVSTLANDVIGTGPTLQVLTENEDHNRQVEARFAEWADEIGLADDLHLMCQAKIVDGEGFAVLVNNPALEGPQLDLALIEADRVTNPVGKPFKPNAVDGIELDSSRNPASYTVLREHPGGGFGISQEADVYRADQVLHWFKKDRCEQFRGIPEATAVLQLFADVRNFAGCSLRSAQIAASFSLMLETEAPAGSVPPPTPFESMDIDKGMMTTLPAGVKAKTLDASQPTAGHGDYIRGNMVEAGRALVAPANVSTGDSSPYNYSSARLDHLPYRTEVLVVREGGRRAALKKIFPAWYREARNVPGYLPAGLPDKLPHAWRWPGFATIDPLKEALADTETLANGTANLVDLLAERNQDFDEHMTKLARVVAAYKKAGLPLPKWAVEGAAVPADNSQPNDPTQPPNKQTDDGAEARHRLIVALLNDDGDRPLNGHHKGGA